MKPATRNSNLSRLLWAVSALSLACVLAYGTGAQTATKTKAAAAANQKTFATPQAAADALIEAAEKFDEAALDAIFGPEGREIVHTGEPAADKERAAAFVAKAREKKNVAVDSNNRNRAVLSVGQEDWPFPVPLVNRGGKWSFDSKAGLQEILFRRIGQNELDAIKICQMFVEAQHEFALLKRQANDVNQYAQRIVSTPGKQDGLAWQNPDGSWGGPVGENIAKAVEKGYSAGEPFHGYYFKVLKGQGPAAPLGQLDFVVKGVMIGGFALIASPAQYRVTGVKSFMVSHDGVVYEKDLGPNTLEVAKMIDRFNPDKTWSPVSDQDQ